MGDWATHQGRGLGERAVPQMSRYHCVFKFDNHRKSVYSDNGIAAFSDGFWVTKDFRYTVLSDCEYWIPPSAILYVRKVRTG